MRMTHATLALALLAIASVPASAGESLAVRIDRLIESATSDVQLSGTADDAEFLRRVYLDLAGRIPTHAEALAFLEDSASDKRTKLIDSLLAGNDYPRRMQELFHVLLMERRGDNEEWTKFLRSAFEQNLPWHRIAQAIIRPDANDEQLRGAAFFLTQRLVKEGAMAPVDVPGLTRDVGRLLAGVDLRCAQCHDHLTIRHYTQKDFQGLHMIFENVQTRRDVKFPAVSEKVMTDGKEYKSVFDQVAMKTGLVVPGGPEVEIVTFKKGEEFAVAPDTKKRTPGVPKFSPLSELATNLATAGNELFCRNIVNRLWFQMMGRGLVEPLDLLHADNQATHPELLKLLATEFAAHEFNIRWLLRELALTKTYQRSSVLGGDTEPPRESYAVALQKRLSAEQLFWSIGVASGEFDAARTALKESGMANGSSETEEANPTGKKPEGEESPDESAPPESDKPVEQLSLEELVTKSPQLQEFREAMITAFANSPKDPEIEFAPTVKGALFLMHEAIVESLLKPRPGNLMAELSEIPDSAKLLDHLFLTILTRQPSEVESRELVPYLEKNVDRRVDAVANLAWALLTSTEFVVNH